jgi:hypothetical protein
MIINQIASGGSGGSGIVVTDGIIIKTRNAEGKALTVDFYGTEVKTGQFYTRSLSQGAWGYMTGITFKNTITEIGADAFYGCENLVLELPENLTSLGSGAFQFCKSLNNVVVPNGITSLESAIFKDCTGLTMVDAPKVTSVSGASASTGCFTGCTALTSVTLGSIGSPVTFIGVYAFNGCTQEDLTINIYVNSAPLANAPWGATNATIKYYDAATGLEIV